MDNNNTKQELILHKLDLAELDRAWDEVKKEKYVLKFSVSVYSVTDLLVDKKGIKTLNKTKTRSMLLLSLVVLFCSFVLSQINDWAMPQSLLFWLGGFFMCIIFTILIERDYEKYNILHQSYLKEEKTYLEKRQNLLKKISDLQRQL